MGGRLPALGADELPTKRAAANALKLESLNLDKALPPKLSTRTLAEGGFEVDAYNNDSEADSPVSQAVRSHSFSSRAQRRQERLYKNPSLRARVPRSVLEGGTAPPFRRRFFTRFGRKFRPNPSVKVEQLEEGLSSAVLYAPENSRDGTEAHMATEFVSRRPKPGDKDLVYRDMPFEIRVAGMFVKPFDRISNTNELLLYSIQTDPSTTGEATQSLPYIHYDFSKDATANTEKANTFLPIPASKSYVLSSPGYRAKSNTRHIPTGWTPPTKSPAGELENCILSNAAGQAAFVGAPPSLPQGSPPSHLVASPTLLSDMTKKGSASIGSSGGNNNNDASMDSQNRVITSPKRRRNKSTSTRKPKRSVNVQFRILEMDKPSQTIKDAVNGIEELGGFIGGFSGAAPILGVLSPALSMVSTISKRALDSYAEPDKVISIDMDFLLADRKRVEASTAPPGEYLRYGYYFFLAEPVEGKLYASVRTPKNVQLMLKRTNYDEKYNSRHHKTTARKYFPLTNVSYLVVRVSEPTDQGVAKYNRKPIHMNHAHRLEDLFKRSMPNAGGDAEDVRNSLHELGVDLGVIDSASDDGGADFHSTQIR